MFDEVIVISNSEKLHAKLTLQSAEYVKNRCCFGYLGKMVLLLCGVTAKGMLRSMPFASTESACRSVALGLRERLVAAVGVPFSRRDPGNAWLLSEPLVPGIESSRTMDGQPCPPERDFHQPGVSTPRL